MKEAFLQTTQDPELTITSKRQHEYANLLKATLTGTIASVHT